MNTQNLTMREFTDKDMEQAQRLAGRLGYNQTAYTSTSALWGLFCFADNPEYVAYSKAENGCIIATEELGLLFVQNVEDITGELYL